MKISRRHIAMAFAGAGLLMAGIAWFIFSEPDAGGTIHPRSAPDSPKTRQPYERIEPAKQAITPEQRAQLLVDRMVLELQQRYAKTISRIGTQAGLLEVKKQIMSMFPGEGAAKFLQILRRAFPEYADQVIDTLNKMEQYQRWLADNEGALAKMPGYDRKTALWEKQRELFGEDADEIWSGEILASEARTAVMQDTMADLGTARDKTIEEKLDAFQAALKQTYENSPDAHILGERFMLSKTFFSLESVQEELKAMPPEDRQSKMNQVRRGMGFSEEEIEKMQLLDEGRDRQWEKGLNYMQERESVVSQYEGAEQQNRLRMLREKYFQEEAGTIELEEKEGFLRFNRPRIYGRN